jgi:DNA-binding response OmpR family regulator
VRGAASRILVVEDDPTLRETISEILTDEGHEVRAAAHGGEAMDHLVGWDADLILLDLMMPTVDAREFRAQQQRHGIASSAKTLILSAARDLASTAAGLEADAWLAKPFSLEDVLRAVAALLEERAEQLESED